MFQKKFIPIYLLTIVNTFSFSLLIPVLPFLLHSYHVGSFFYGIIFSVFSFFQFFATPLFGSLSDKFGRRKILLITQLGTFVSWFIFALALLIDPSIHLLGLPASLWVILAARIFDGITGGNQSVSTAYIADLTPEKDRTKVFGVIGMLVGIGMVIGPALGGFSVHFRGNFFGPILISLILSSFTFLYLLFGLRESLPVEKRDQSPVHDYLNELLLWNKIKKFLGSKYLSYLILIVFFFGFIFQGFTTSYVWYAVKILDLTVLEASCYMIMLGVFFAFNQGFLLRKLTSYYNDEQLLFFGFVVLTVGLGLMVNELNILGFILVSYLASLGVSFVFSTSKSLLTQNVDVKHQGAITGIEDSLHSFNRIIAPLIAGLVWGLYGEIVFGLFAVISLIPVIIMYGLIRSRQDHV